MVAAENATEAAAWKCSASVAQSEAEALVLIVS